MLAPEDFLSGELSGDEDLSHLNIDTKTDPVSEGKLEGDIAGIDDIHAFMDRSNQRGRNAIRSKWRRWPNGEIPYVLSSRYGRYSRKIIARAMSEYAKKTCIKFVPRDEQRDYIYIYPDDGCYSLVGRTGGRQPVSLDAGCIQTGTVIHELMHTVGFFHEQSRNDRDEYIQIVWDNVLRGASDQFDKYSLRTISHLDEPYDYSSIMHYGPYAFTRNGRRTVVPKKSGGRKMGQREGFSRIDLRKINKLYHCEEKIDNSEETDSNEVEETNGPARPEPKRPSGGECKDNNWRCFFWTMQVINYCEKYEKVRNEVCPKSCGTCKEGEIVENSGEGEEEEVEEEEEEEVEPTPKPTIPEPAPTTAAPPESPSESGNCEDKNSHCERWSKSNLCTKRGYSNFMAKYCPKSCNACENADEEQRNGEDAASGSCKDSRGYKMQCHFIKQLGGCRSTRNRNIVRNHCRKSCKLCTSGA